MWRPRLRNTKNAPLIGSSPSATRATAGGGAQPRTDGSTHLEAEVASGPGYETFLHSSGKSQLDGSPPQMST